MACSTGSIGSCVPPEHPPLVRYAILSDVHGNLEALRAVLADAATRADGILCLGDSIGYGADPGACVEILDRRACAIVAGNHEYGVAGLLDLAWFNGWARAAAEWTRERLDDDHRAWLGSLPLTSHVGDATLVHASPEAPDEWDYLVRPEDGWSAFAHFETRWCFVGHSHVPGMWSLGSSGPEFEPRPVAVSADAGRRYIVNVGSVGQPRDRDPRAAYGIWDVDAARVELRRVIYDVQAARDKIVAAGLPHFLADRLAAGT
jgi:diadenosine tetraphosphatase ApaH/serine/threonine PP2A family protein phosphatase